MKRLLLMIMLVGASAAAQSPEELYGEYITPEAQALLGRFEEAERQSQEAEAAAKSRRTLALSVAILIGLIPLVHIGRDIIRKKSWRDNPGGTVRALLTGIAGGVVLFGLNYGIFILKVRMGDAFNTTLAFLIVGALIAGSLYILNKNT